LLISISRYKEEPAMARKKKSKTPKVKLNEQRDKEGSPLKIEALQEEMKDMKEILNIRKRIVREKK
jgi:hypothetical protein